MVLNVHLSFPWAQKYLAFIHFRPFLGCLCNAHFYNLRKVTVLILLNEALEAEYW